MPLRVLFLRDCWLKDRKTQEFKGRCNNKKFNVLESPHSNFLSLDRRSVSVSSAILRRSATSLLSCTLGVPGSGKEDICQRTPCVFDVLYDDEFIHHSSPIVLFAAESNDSGPKTW